MAIVGLTAAAIVGATASVAGREGSGLWPAQAVEQARPIEPVGTFVGPPAGEAPSYPGTTDRMSVGSDGRQGNGASGGTNNLVASPNANQAISADGRWVAFASLATNLIPGTPTPNGGMFVHDRETGQTLAAPWFDGPVFPAGVVAAEPAISADGGVIAFTVIATALQPTSGVFGGQTAVPYVVAWDRAGINTIEVVSIDGRQGPTPGHQPSISANGQFIAYTQWFVDRTPPVPTNPTTSTAGLAYSPCGPQTATITTTVTDPDDPVSSVTLFYAPSGMGTFTQAMSPVGGDTWQGSITLGSGWNLGQIQYWVQATDSHGNTSGQVFPSGSNVLTLESCIL
jgi:hypothetical protein